QQHADGDEAVLQSALEFAEAQVGTAARWTPLWRARRAVRRWCCDGVPARRWRGGGAARMWRGGGAACCWGRGAVRLGAGSAWLGAGSAWLGGGRAVRLAAGPAGTGRWRGVALRALRRSPSGHR
ncbi:MAG TPA: hypothetical protein VKB75_13825, partial [Jatrophihabitans sp.]|nr:hypothetical protein [Jatrophihabitans sp.]